MRKSVDEEGRTRWSVGRSTHCGNVCPAHVRPAYVRGACKREAKGVAFTLLLVLLLLLLSQGPAFSENYRKGQREPDHVETYDYRAVPIGKESDTEQIRMVLSFEDDAIGFVSTSVSQKTKEKVALRMTGEGDLISGKRSLTGSPGRVARGKIWRVGNRVCTYRSKKTFSADIPKGTILAIKGSLLVLLRSFPYGTGDQWNLLMIEFSGKSIRATVRQTGTERISVPAGEFLCYRVEVRFHVPILNPVVVCWVDVKEPHVVIKSVGKRGIFTPTYVTTLVGKE